MPRSCISSWSWWKILEGHWFVKCLFSEGVMLSQNVPKINLPNVIMSPLLLPWEILRDPERLWILDDFCGFTWLYQLYQCAGRTCSTQTTTLGPSKCPSRPKWNHSGARCFFEKTQFVTQFYGIYHHLSPIYIYKYYIILYIYILLPWIQVAKADAFEA